MKYLALIFLSLLWIIQSPNPANAGATHLRYDYHHNAVENLEKTPVQKPKIAEWAKQKKPVWRKKLAYKSRKPTALIDFETDIIAGSVLILAGLIFLGIGLGVVLTWAFWLGGVLFVLGLVWVLFAGTDLYGFSAFGEGLLLFVILISGIFLLGLVLLIIGLIIGLAWAWITGTIILSLYLLVILIILVAMLFS